jgi:polysaccharide export outer membrane protein
MMRSERRAMRGGRRWVVVAVVVTCAGCGAHRPTAPPGTTASASSPRADGVSATTDDGQVMSSRDRAGLESLARSRATLPAADGYRVGPDDLLDVRIPDLLDAAPLTGTARGGAVASAPSLVAAAPVFQDGLRVTAAGDVTLPLIGRVPVAGRTTTEIERDLRRRLVAAGVLRNPQVSVHVAEYRSRVVAVVGSVERPGLYPVTRTAATVADIVWAAGGPSKDAGRFVELAPAAADGTRSADPPVRLDMQVLLHAAGAEAARVNPRVAPGDVISVPAAGSVLVEGWVDKPGSYPVTRGLTASGAVAAAGGPLFAADRSAVTVRRVLGPGEERSFTLDLTGVADGRVPDVALADGDVITIGAAPGRVVPWAMWTIAREMVHVGGNVLLF